MSDPTPNPDVNSDTPPTTPVTPPPGRAWKIFLREIFETLGLAVLLFVAINLISARVRVDGYSMRPTLDDGEFILVSRLSYEIGRFHRGDIIIFRPPMYPEEPFLRRFLGFPDFNTIYEDYIKRVIGLPGDTVKVENGEVLVNGVKLTETYIAEAPLYSGEWVVPSGNLFVMGDNRNNSSDSHAWGFVPTQNVLGKALLVYWPISDWMVINSGGSALAAH